MTRPENIGCLLIHGFTSSPTEMAGLADRLRDRGYRVNLPLLPGHATHPEELLQVTYHDWITTVESALRDLQTETQRQIVMGLSMGAVLALHLASTAALTAVVVLAPALKLPLWKEAGTHLLAQLNLTRHKTRGPDVNDDYGRHVLDSYREYPIRATREVFRLQRRVRGALPRVTAPLFVAHSRRDHTIPVRNVDYLLRRVRSQYVEKMIVQNSYHVLTVDRDRDAIFARILEFITRVTTLQLAEALSAPAH